MGIFSVSLGYVILRTAVGIAVSALILRGSRAFGFVAFQSLADLAAAFLVVAYVDLGLRTALGYWVILMFLFVVAWEAWVVLKRLAPFIPFCAQFADDDGGPTTAITSMQAVAWTVFAVLPAIGAGLFLTMNALYPHSWLFPGMPASSVAPVLKS